jgi:AcrR family transcriptional regulator
VSDDLRARIVDAAIRLLETKGAKGFGQVRVAREAGLQQGHLTYYFPKKSDLVGAVLERLAERTQADLGDAMARLDTSDPAAAEALFFERVRRLLRDRKRSRILVGLMAESIDDPDVAAALVDMVRAQRTAVAMLLGRDPEDPDVYIATAALRGLGIENLVEPDDPARVEAVLARFRAWFGARVTGR